MEAIFIVCCLATSAACVWAINGNRGPQFYQRAGLALGFTALWLAAIIGGIQ